jgi:hypothetical protein
MKEDINFNFYKEILRGWVEDFHPRISLHQLQGLCERLTTSTASAIGLDPVVALHCGSTVDENVKALVNRAKEIGT